MVDQHINQASKDENAGHDGGRLDGANDDQLGDVKARWMKLGNRVPS